MLDPRPHLGEPPALDLLNTRWMDHGPRDLLTDVSGLEIWLDSAGLSGAPANQRMLDAVLTTRTAIYDAVVHGSRDALNEVLDRGRIRRHLTESGPAATPEIDDPAWRPGWLAADNLLTLLAEAPARIRRCAHADCILFFYDTSKNGTRRWHSMTTCGNRAKAARYHARRT
ncbi:CGNR zinc finger domain-containing protein [Nocardia sp. NPDC019395]|uniref:CGNR zinc finger domain-containing protein n=1 Tax=Nocardia sp. NPDC019395 TaxID=3154686 RepID=UPI0033E97E6E